MWCNEVHHNLHIVYFILAIAQHIPFALPARTEIKGNQINSFMSQFQTLEFMASVSMEIKERGEEGKIFGEDNERKFLFSSVGKSESLIENLGSKFAWD